MNVHMHNSRTPLYRLNGYENPHSEDDLQFLSLEERECILFFENTIGSIEEEIENEGVGIPARNHTPAEVRPRSYTTPTLRDHDIIDLVHSEPSKHTNVTPDFQRPPETHFERKSNREPFINVSAPVSEEGGHQPPPGSVPTPVVIASKIAENQGASSASTSPSFLLQHRRSLELPGSPSAKHGPPTHAKPTHLPDNISVLLGSRENLSHSIAAEAVDVQGRRAQVLANLSGSAHPLEGGEPSCIRNIPTRSVSFQQPTADKSRLEALSKLGLAQRRTQSVMQPSAKDLNNKDNSAARTALRSNSTPPQTFNSVNEPRIPRSVPASNRNTSSASNIAAKVHGMDTTDHSLTNSTADRHDKFGETPALKSAEITHSDFNSFGGKSISLNPTTSLKSEQVPNHNATATSSPKSDAQEIHLNSFGGWSRVMTPSVVHRDDPNRGSSSYSRTPPDTSHMQSPPNSYGARSKTFSQVKEVTSSHHGSRTTDEDPPTRDVTSLHLRPPSQTAAIRPAKQPPSPAQRPPRQSTPLSPTRPKPTPPSPELRRSSISKPSFRTQGVTVQFSGKGATDEARRDALRRLGLLKGSP
ncbi:uncharacterized protein [Misgurnus anguillicaudatus]|uniref:uncharacterized protein n=1 Tax=Misgurnus anguillicaudatus TaxID=75329 RepID=UPI003CCFB48E